MASEFDSARGAFWLVAGVIAVQMVISLTIVGGCVFGAIEHVIPTGGCKGVMEQIKELVQMSFTAAIAFAGGRLSAPAGPPPPKLPEK